VIVLMLLISSVSQLTSVLRTRSRRRRFVALVLWLPVRWVISATELSGLRGEGTTGWGAGIGARATRGDGPGEISAETATADVALTSLRSHAAGAWLSGESTTTT